MRLTSSVEKGDDVLYNLSRVNSDLLRSRVSLIGISNDLKFTEFLDPRVKSSLGEDEIIFPPYNAEQIKDILGQRAKLAFKPGVLEDDVIPYVLLLQHKNMVMHGEPWICSGSQESWLRGHAAP